MKICRRSFYREVRTNQLVMVVRIAKDRRNPEVAVVVYNIASDHKNALFAPVSEFERDFSPVKRGPLRQKFTNYKKKVGQRRVR